MNNAPFPERDGVSVLEFKNKLFLFGGWDPRREPTTNSEVWSSSDGQEWNLVTENAPWPNRHCAGHVVFKDKMWLISGDGNADVWNTIDGKNWFKVLGEAPWGRRYKPYVVVYKNKIWLMGGLDIDNGHKPLNDVWVTEDGENWERVNEHADWEGRGIIHGGVVFQNKIWIIGGGDYGYPLNKSAENYNNDVWNTEDGINWVKVSDFSPWRSRIHHSIHVYADRMWVIAGHNFNYHDYLFNDVWFSADGINWNELKDSPFPVRHATSVVNFNDKMWMLLGYFHNDIWNLEIKGLTFISQPIVSVKQGEKYLYSSHADFNKKENALHYRLLDAPPWLSMDSNSGQLNGAVPCNIAGDFNVELEAYTNQGESTIQKFNLKVLPDKKNITISQVGNCIDNKVTLKSDLVLDSYLWSTGETTKEILVSEPGDYKLFYENAFGCIDSSNVFSINERPIIIANDDPQLGDTLVTQHANNILWYLNDQFLSNEPYIIVNELGTYHATYVGGSCQSISKPVVFGDLVKPEVVVRSTVRDSITGPFQVNIIFTEDIIGFSIDDISVENGQASNFEPVSSREFEAIINPLANGVLQIVIEAGTANDVAGNSNYKSNSLKLVYDTIPPSGYAIAFNQDMIEFNNQSAASIQISGAEIGAFYRFRISSYSGGEPIEGSAIVREENFVIKDIDLMGLADGLITASLTLIDPATNEGEVMNSHIQKNTKDLVNYSPPDTVIVPFYSSTEDLPTFLEVTYSSGETDQLPVSWQLENFNSTIAGSVNIVGSLDLPPDASNLEDIQPVITIVVEPNKAPLNLYLNNNVFKPDIVALDEAGRSPEAIGEFSTNDADDHIHYYSLIQGPGDSQNNLFRIVDNKLYLNSNRGLYSQHSFSIRVRTTDPLNNILEQVFVITKADFDKTLGEFTIANAFSPNRDGKNDDWVIPQLRFFKDVTVEVYARSGARVFSSDNPEIGWNGKGASGQVIKGVYLYVIKIKDINVVKKGVVTII